MTPRQLFNYYKDKRDVPCSLTNELIESGFVQRIGGEVDEEENAKGNVKTYYKVFKNKKIHIIPIILTLQKLAI